MNQQLSTAIDFYLETEKINPFFQHLSGNASSSDLIQLRNSAYILNKLSLLNLEHSSANRNQNSFQQSHLQLFSVTLESIINNPSMPYKDFQSVRDLVRCIQHYHWLLTKLTYTEDGKDERTRTILKKVSINSFWPRIRALLIGVEQKIPSSHQYIKEYVVIRRGLLETDKKYFISQMMAKKIETNQLKQLIAKYQIQEQNNISLQKQEQEIQDANDQNANSQKMDQIYNEVIEDWSKVKMSVRMLSLTNQLSDWNTLLQYLQTEKYRYEISQEEKQRINQYIHDILGDLQNEKVDTHENGLFTDSLTNKNTGENMQQQKQDLNSRQRGLKNKIKQKILSIIKVDKQIFNM